jgi:di/tricarboxylate transporter
MASIVFLGLNLAAWITIVTVLAMFLLLTFTHLPEDLAFLGVIAVFYITGILDEKEALSGFSSNSVVMVGVLFAVVAGLVHTGVLQWMVKHLLGIPKSYKGAIVRLMLPVAALSSVLSNTTVVALFVNIVKIWAKKLNIAPSKLLIPLSYASGMGGICTLIGTPPNLIISGMYAERTGQHMNIFITTIPGLFCLAVGVISMVAMRKMLPVRKAPSESFTETKDFTVELLVPSDNDNIGKTVEEANLNNVNGGRLIEIVRFDKEVISPVADDEFIMGGDRLVFAGEVAEILELKKTKGLVVADHHVFSVSETDPNRKLRTAYITPGSTLIGSSMNKSQFEKEQAMTLVAVARQGERIKESPRDMTLEAGDSLLLECPPKQDVNKEIKGLHFFESDNIIPNINGRTIVSSLIMVGMVLLSAFDIVPLLESCMLAAIAMLIFKCCTPQQAMKSIEWNILMIFVGSVVIGTAIEKTGVAEAIANGLLSVCGGHPLLVMIAMCFAGTFITEFISNTACGAIFCPIVYEAAVSMHVNPVPFMISLMIAVSSSFATPIGSPTHMLVYGPGGYRFTDFMKVGILMNIIILAANIFIVSLLFPL